MPKILGSSLYGYFFWDPFLIAFLFSLRSQNNNIPTTSKNEKRKKGTSGNVTSPISLPQEKKSRIKEDDMYGGHKKASMTPKLVEYHGPVIIQRKYTLGAGDW